MSTTPPATPATTPPPNELTVVSHSTLFYWWPVWVFGYIIALITYFDGHYMVIVPKETDTNRKFWVVKTEAMKPGTSVEPKDLEEREGYLVRPAPPDHPEQQKHLAPYDSKNDETKKNSLNVPPELKMHSTHGKSLGVIWATVLLLVIFVTNVPLRGMWSVLIIVVIISISVILAAFGYWDEIFAAVALLGIQMNMAGYIFISTGLFVMWSVAFFFFDRQTYVIFAPGRMRVCLEIGDGEVAYDSLGMVIEHQRNDLFRHWILGFGSGDLIVRTSGANTHEFRLPNVLFLKWNLHKIQELQSRRDHPKQ